VINRCRIAWNALIAAYCQSGRGEEAVSCFDRMRGGSSPPPPDAITFACILKACGEIGATQKGAEIHAEIVKKGLSEDCNSIIVGTALVDMYAKCGMLGTACGVFSRLRGPNVVSWTALISGYARLGCTGDAHGLFRKMMEQGMAPNHVTFVVVLGSCSSSGLAHEGETYFGYITKTFGLAPRSEHYACMVSLFGRIGRFGKAVEAIHKLPSSQHLPAWYALLTACQTSGNLNLGKLVFQRLQ
jgi:pentatricopeptide repeat protein